MDSTTDNFGCNTSAQLIMRCQVYVLSKLSNIYSNIKENNAIEGPQTFMILP